MKNFIKVWHFQPCLITRRYNSSAPKDCSGDGGLGWKFSSRGIIELSGNFLRRIEYWVTGETATEIPIWVNYNDLTTTSLEWWLIRGIIPVWPYFRFVNYYNLPRPILVRMISPTTTLAYIRWKTRNVWKIMASWIPIFVGMMIQIFSWHIFSCSGARGVDTTVCITGLTTATRTKPWWAEAVSTCRMAERSILHAGDLIGIGWLGDQGMAFHGQ